MLKEIRDFVVIYAFVGCTVAFSAAIILPIVSMF